MENQDYYHIQEENKRLFMAQLKIALPEYYDLISLMDKLNGNPVILFHVLTHMNEVAAGSGFGQVHITIEEGVVRFVRGEHQTKLQEPIQVHNESI